MPAQIDFNLSYRWVPFTLSGSPYFYSPDLVRLEAAVCSHDGPVIYKWEGLLADGIRGVLIGEAKNLRQRIRQYRNGKQKAGNRYWREEFLSKGTIHLHVLEVLSCRYQGREFQPDFRLKHWRLIFEQFLIAEEKAKQAPNVKVFNKT